MNITDIILFECWEEFFYVRFTISSRSREGWYNLLGGWEEKISYKALPKISSIAAIERGPAITQINKLPYWFILLGALILIMMCTLRVTRWISKLLPYNIVDESERHTMWLSLFLTCIPWGSLTLNWDGYHRMRGASIFRFESIITFKLTLYVRLWRTECVWGSLTLAPPASNHQWGKEPQTEMTNPLRGVTG
jgi:hypothetical protein